MYNYNNKWIFW